MAEVHGHGLGVAKQEGTRGRKVQQQRHQNGADGVNVLDGVERDAAQHGGGVVTKVARGIAVGSFVHCDGKQHRKGVDKDGLYQIVHGVIVSNIHRLRWFAIAARFTGQLQTAGLRLHAHTRAGCPDAWA